MDDRQTELPPDYKGVSDASAARNMVGRENTLLQATRRERASILFCFGLAAASVCAAVATSAISFPDVAAIICSNVATFVAVGGATSFGMKFLDAKQDASIENQEKLEHLRYVAEEYGQRMGMRRIPKIGTRRIGKKSQTVDFIWKPIIMFDDKTLKESELPQLEGILAHEMAHIKGRHMLALAATFVLMYGAAKSFGLAGQNIPAYFLLLQTLPVCMKLSRAFEFEADGVGAAVSGRREEMGAFFNGLVKETWGQKFEKWGELPRKQKIRTLVCSTGALPYKATNYVFWGMHPNEERRLERLTTKEPLKHYPSDSLKARLSRLFL